jgi:ubiquitin-protein ligase
MASKRLIKELDAYNRERSAAVVSLEPVSDDDLFQLRAVLRGPDETASEGMESSSLQSQLDTKAEV